MSKISELNIETLIKLNVHIPVSNYFDRHSTSRKNLLDKFENKFYHKMGDYSILSFKSILHFCTNIKQFSFQRVFKKGGYVNTDVRICLYKDFKLIPAN